MMPFLVHLMSRLFCVANDSLEVTPLNSALGCLSILSAEVAVALGPQQGECSRAARG